MKKRQTRRQGHIRQRGPRAFEIAVNLGSDANGKRRRKVETIHGSRADAQRRLRELQTAQDRGLSIASEKWTVEQWMHRWLNEKVASSASQTTQDRYEENTRGYIVPAMGHILLHRLTPADVETFQSDLLARGLAPRTVQLAHQVLSGALRWAYRLDMIPRIVTEVVSIPKPAKGGELELPDATTVRRILEHARETGDQYHVALHTLTATGARRGEVLALNWSSVDLESAAITINRTVGRTRKGIQFGPPKSDRSRRRVDIDPETVGLLREHKARQAEHRLRLGPAYDGTEDLVFADAIGRPVNPQAVTRTLQKLAKEVGVDHIKLHSLRHFHASLLLSNGADLFLVSRRLGHNNISTTANVYGHLIEGRQKQAAAMFAEAMRRA